MVFFCSAVVCVCGLEGIVEVSEVYAFVIVPDCGAPPAFFFCEPDAFVSGAVFSFPGIPGVLGYGGGAKVCLSVVQAVAIDMVDYQAIANMAMAVMSFEC